MKVRSRGTSARARKQITAEDLKWADKVFVMEDKHLSRLRADYPGESRHKDIYVLDIPDDYKFGDPELIAEIKETVDAILDEHFGTR